jgi:hypothetical protein
MVVLIVLRGVILLSVIMLGVASPKKERASLINFYRRILAGRQKSRLKFVLKPLFAK